MNKKTQVLVALVLAIFAALLVAGYLTSLENKYRRGAEKVPVLVARGYIDQGTMIEPRMVQEIQIPKEFIQPRALTSASDLVGKEGIPIYMAIVPIVEGEQIIGTKLFSLGSETGLATVIPGERRALAVMFDRQEVKGIIRPGNRVDVIACFDYYGAKNERHEAAITILQNIPVLAVGKSVMGALQPLQLKKGRIEAAVAAEPEESQVPVALAVLPQEAEVLALAKNKGNIFLSLRPTGDEKIIPLPGMSMEKIFGKEVRTITAKDKDALANQQYLEEIRKQQQEAMELLKKYQKK